MNVVGPKIRELRESKGMTQEEFAARCNVNDWDISRGTFAKIEAQVRRVTDDEVARWAEILGVDLKELYPSS